MSFERIKKINGHEYKYLVENVRNKDTGKVQQKIIKYLGRVDKISAPKSAPEVNSVTTEIKIPEGYKTIEEKEEYLQEITDGSGYAIVLVDMETYERLLRRRKTPQDTTRIVLNRIMDGEIHQQPR